MRLIKNFDLLASSPERKAALEIVEAGLEAIQPEKVLADWSLEEGNYQRIFLVGFGKGSAGIAKALEEKLGDKLTAGWVIDVMPVTFKKIEFTSGTHPLPSQINIDFTRKVMANKFTSSDLVLVVVCGGGSAMLTDPTVTLAELIETNKQLLTSGKTIIEMNNDRKETDRVKGGGLAKFLSPAKVMGLIFSDVPGNDLATIASGPTVPDEPLSNVTNVLMLSNLTALAAMKKKTEEMGFRAEVVTDTLQGEARQVGVELVARIKDMEDGKRALLFGGETTVTVKGNGKGGRNQELVLAAIDTLKRENISGITVASVDSDGWDNGEVAGAISDGLKLDPAEFLRNNDAGTFFEKTGDGIITGRLPSNVADLMVVLKK